MEDLLAGLAVSPDRPAEEANSPEGDAEHPRFSKYKNEGKVAEMQRQRREEHLERQSKLCRNFTSKLKMRSHRARDEWLGRYRDIKKAGVPAEPPEQKNAFALRRGNNQQYRKSLSAQASPYINFLMHSDWLVDIPVTLSTEWTLVPSPVGRRCLIVAQNGQTYVYYRNGKFALQFNSALPGGGGTKQGGEPRGGNGLTILDCICASRTINKREKFYALDLLWWNNHMLTDTEFTCRQFLLHSRLQELATDGVDGADRFMPLPSCPCSPEEVTKFMQNEFPFQLDGLLFYYNSAYYIPGQTPLVGWLKPWMLPEILGVSVPEHYTKDVHYANSKDFIAEYNKKHGHLSTTEKEQKKAKEEEEGVAAEPQQGSSMDDGNKAKEKEDDGPKDEQMDDADHGADVATANGPTAVNVVEI